MKTIIDETKVYSRQMEERAILSAVNELMELTGDPDTVKRAKREIINRKNGEKYGRELAKLLKEKGVVAILSQGNEAGDVVLPDLNIIIECRTTSAKGGYGVSKNNLSQYFYLRGLPQEVWFAIKWKGQGISGWRLYRIPDKTRVLYRSEGYTIEEFIIMKRPEEG
jgi:Holliday junction resolvase